MTQENKITQEELAKKLAKLLEAPCGHGIDCPYPDPSKGQIDDAPCIGDRGGERDWICWLRLIKEAVPDQSCKGCIREYKQPQPEECSECTRGGASDMWRDR